ncbi:hypothetical protein B4096_3052 [Heyndrickxia coagulans]|jgi:hypothetical protein|nr:hypothetical protein B4096_3052 [Heyndrickxia coagulans]
MHTHIFRKDKKQAEFPLFADGGFFLSWGIKEVPTGKWIRNN